MKVVKVRIRNLSRVSGSTSPSLFSFGEGLSLLQGVPAGSVVTKLSSDGSQCHFPLSVHLCSETAGQAFVGREPLTQTPQNSRVTLPRSPRTVPKHCRILSTHQICSSCFIYSWIGSQKNFWGSPTSHKFIGPHPEGHSLLPLGNEMGKVSVNLYW